MFTRGFDNAYAHEAERRKDDMRDAANHNLARKYSKGRNSTVVSIATLSIIGWLLVILLGS